MIFNFVANGRSYKMDLPPDLRVGITRHLMQLYSEYCAANPSESLSFVEYLSLVEKSPHPENEDVVEQEIEDYDMERKDFMIDVLLDTISKLR